MPTYLLLTKLTTEGRQRIAEHPERLEQVNLEVKDFGCKIVGQYAVMGQYDFLTVIEAPRQRNDRPSLRRSRLAGHNPHHVASRDPDRSVHREAQRAHSHGQEVGAGPAV